MSANFTGPNSPRDGDSNPLDQSDSAEKRRLAELRRAGEDADNFAASKLVNDGVELNNGRISNAAGQIAQALQTNSAEAKRKKDRENNSIYLATLRQINQWQAEIDLWSKEIAEFESKLDALDELEELYAQGDLDPTNPHHAALMEKAGITKEDLETDPQAAFGRQRRYFNGEIDSRQRRIEENEQRIDAAEQRNYAGQSMDGAFNSDEHFDERRNDLLETRQANNENGRLGDSEPFADFLSGIEPVSAASQLEPSPIGQPRQLCEQFSCAAEGQNTGTSPQTGNEIAATATFTNS